MILSPRQILSQHCHRPLQRFHGFSRSEIINFVHIHKRQANYGDLLTPFRKLKLQTFVFEKILRCCKTCLNHQKFFAKPQYFATFYDKSYQLWTRQLCHHHSTTIIDSSAHFNTKYQKYKKILSILFR